MTTADWRGWAWRRRACAALIIAMAGGLAASPSATAGEAMPAGLVGSWSFEHVSGQVTPDASDQANHATVGSGTLVKGAINAGLRCDGRATRVTCAPSPSLHPTKGLALEAWVKPQALKFAGYPPVIRKEECYGLRFGDGHLGFVLWIDGKIAYLVSKRAEWPLGRWYHLVATYDGAQMRLFVDGAEDGASPREQTGAIDTSATPLYIGSSASGARLDGVIDEVRIFSRALSPAEIQAAHAAGRRTLEAEKELVIEPRDVGDAYPVLRKPPKKIAMVKDGFLWIDAEDFDDYGGWWLDTQFVHLMGSSYLIAAGIGKPVKDATVDVQVPKAGRYRLWVRARNWLKAHSPGRFRVRIGDREAEHVFGQADSDRWLWEHGGDFDLPKGTVRIALHDLTGYYSRCDVLVLTTALDYVPPKAVPDIVKERSRLTGLSLAPKDAGEYDVIVVGAGAAGSCAAIAAARLGARTALIQNRPVLGGNASIEMGVPISGASSSKPNARESGIIEEAGRVKARYGYPKMSEPFRILAEKEKNLTVFLNCHVFDVVMKDKQTIAAVKAVDTLTGGISVYRAKQFLDCTGDGWVGYFAGAKYRFGRESRDEHNESLAPEKGDSITMSGCLMGRRALSYRAEDMGKVAPYEPPPWAARFPPPLGFGRRIKGFVSG
ncbi:FAD-dependent oxidoreductase [bacterium]|nr:FAD-dependent oxidoreductase [bacterium]